MLRNRCGCSLLLLLVLMWSTAAPGQEVTDPADTALADTVGAVKGTGLETLEAPALEKRVRPVAPGGDQLGYAVAAGGDVNRDLYPDLLVSAFAHDSAAGDAGAVFLFSGRDGDTIRVLFGENRADHFGIAAAFVGDLNGDAYADFAVGAPDYDLDDSTGANAGRVYVYSGADTTQLYTLTGDRGRMRFGVAVAGVADLNGDGTPDFAIGQEVSGDSVLTDVGLVSVFSGATGGLLQAFAGSEAGDRFGAAIADGGDVDGDGYGDMIIGAYRRSLSGPSAGAVHVYSGKGGTPLYELAGEGIFSHFGFAVAGAGDVDADGRGDLLVGARFNDAAGGRAGRAYLVSGATGNYLRSFGPDAAGGQYGSAVAAAGDVNNDNVPDLAIGAPRAAGGGRERGVVYLMSGKDGAKLRTLNGEGRKDLFGCSVADAGDIDRDGYPDLLVGACGNDAGGLDAGRAYLFSGRTGEPLFTFTGTSGLTAADTARPVVAAPVVPVQAAASEERDTIPEIVYDSTEVDAAPILRRSASADYPDAALGSGLSGWVYVRVLVAADGAPLQVQIVDDSGLGPDFRDAAIKTAREWLFLAATKEGQPVATWTIETIGFAPPEESADTAQVEPADSAVAITPDTAVDPAQTDSAAGTVVAEVTTPDSTLSPTVTDSVSPAVVATDSSAVTQAPAEEPPADSMVEATVPPLDDQNRDPVLVGRVDPQYPAAARIAGDTGTVVLRFLVDTLGNVEKLEVVMVTAPGKGFEGAARAAGRRWRFEAARKEGAKVAAWVEYPVGFGITPISEE